MPVFTKHSTLRPSVWYTPTIWSRYIHVSTCSLKSVLTGAHKPPKEPKERPTSVACVKHLLSRCLRVHMHVHTQNTETLYTGFSRYIHVGRDNVSIAINGRVESTILYYQRHIYTVYHTVRILGSVCPISRYYNHKPREASVCVLECVCVCVCVCVCA